MSTSARGDVVAVIFDMDGLLLDTEAIYTEAMQSVLHRFGKSLDRGLRQQTVGLGARALAASVVATLSLPLSADELLEEREPHLQARLMNAAAMPGARELVLHLARHRIPMAVATSSRLDSLQRKAHRHGEWFAHFSAVVTPDDAGVLAPKPAPDVFRIAAERIGVRPDRALAFEDSPIGVQAAIAAGMRVIAVPHAAMDRSRFSMATAILDSLSEFRPQDWGLPARER